MTSVKTNFTTTFIFYYLGLINFCPLFKNYFALILGFCPLFVGFCPLLKMDLATKNIGLSWLFSFSAHLPTFFS